jgi:hypothetical protein
MGSGAAEDPAARAGGMIRSARTIAATCDGDPRSGGHRQPIEPAGWCGMGGLYDMDAGPGINPLIRIIRIVALLPAPQL